MEAPLILLLALVLLAHGAAAKPQKKVDPPPGVVLEVITCGGITLWLKKNDRKDDKPKSGIPGWDIVKVEGLAYGAYPITIVDGDLYINGKKCDSTKDLSERPAKQAPPPTTSIKIELSCTSENAPDLKEMRVAYEAKNGQSTYFYPVYVTKDGTFGVIDNYRRTYQIDLVGGTDDYLMSYWWFGEHKQKPRMKLHYKLTLFADHTATLADEHTDRTCGADACAGDKKLDKIVYKCTEVHQ
jgi:hypothetical protein